MKKILMITGAAAAMIILGIGIYQTDASQKSQLLSEDAIKELIDSQYPGEIKTIDQQDDNYKMEIHHEGNAYDLIVDGYDGRVKQLIEGRKLTVKETSEKEEANPPENEPEKLDKENESDQAGEETVEGSSTESNMETSIEKSKSEGKNESDTKKTDKDVKKAKKNVEKKEKAQQKKQEKKKKKDQDKEQKNAAISEKEAIAIALKEFSGKVTEIELDDDDGRLIYEIEVERDDTEAEIEIDAHSGEIIYMEIDD